MRRRQCHGLPSPQTEGVFIIHVPTAMRETLLLDEIDFGHFFVASPVLGFLLGTCVYGFVFSHLLRFIPCSVSRLQVHNALLSFGT